MASIVVTIEDIFDELLIENNRLINELLFANKLKKFLMKLIEKYESVIDCEDKQQFNDLTQEMTINGKRCLRIDCNEIKDNTKEVNVSETDKRIARRRQNRRQIIAKKLKANNDENDKSKKLSKVKTKATNHIYSGHNETNGETDPNSKTYDKSIGELIRSANCFDSVTNQWSCPETGCHKVYNIYSSIYKHIHSCHRDGQQIVCNYPDCGKTLKGRDSYVNHLKIHTEDSVYVCQYKDCNRRYITQSRLTTHMKIHSTYRVECPLCHRKFTTKGNLAAHQRNKCRLTTTVAYNCVICGQHFRTHYRLRDHKAKIHDIHRRINIRSCEWPGCDYTTKRSYLLKYHMNRVHRNYRPFVCDWPDCDKRFINKEILNDHKNMHLKIKRHACQWPGCTFRCTLRCNLYKHKKVRFFFEEVFRKKTQTNTKKF
ncbi:zinc finger protein 708-like [Oppia nitens]|uniref:zinc finger protein 708-like n=1 Tax=Oppia nitens TaxID=1686743 RepID=UPI0023DBB94A|nr:zinc finger protein 708-like [Oppia nitens]